MFCWSSCLLFPPFPIIAGRKRGGEREKESINSPSAVLIRISIKYFASEFHEHYRFIYSYPTWFDAIQRGLGALRHSPVAITSLMRGSSLTISIEIIYYFKYIILILYTIVCFDEKNIFFTQRKSWLPRLGFTWNIYLFFLARFVF